MMDFSPSPKELDSLQAIFPLSGSQIDELKLFVDRLCRWQQKSNLIASSTLPAIWTRHIADSLQICRFLSTNCRVVDIGSGGGLPGIVIATVFNGQPGFEIDLVESNQKKCAFLRSVSRELNLSARINPMRIESFSKQYTHDDPRQLVVTARALASLDRLFELSFSMLNQGSGCFHKGRGYVEEVELCRTRWNFKLKVHQSRVDDESVILEVRDVSLR